MRYESTWLAVERVIESQFARHQFQGLREVVVLVASALAQGTSKLDRRFGTVLFLYLFTTFLAAVVAVLTSRLFPQTLSLGKAAKADVVPQGLSEVIQTLLTNIVANPIQAIIDGNYICILMWACLFGLAMKSIANESSKAFMANVADAVSQVIRWVINLAPFGIMGLVFTNVADNGLSAFTEYMSLSSPSFSHSCMLTGMFAAEERVKNAVRPDSLKQR